MLSNWRKPPPRELFAMQDKIRVTRLFCSSSQLEADRYRGLLFKSAGLIENCLKLSYYRVEVVNNLVCCCYMVVLPDTYWLSLNRRKSHSNNRRPCRVCDVRTYVGNLVSLSLVSIAERTERVSKAWKQMYPTYQTIITTDIRNMWIRVNNVTTPWRYSTSMA